MEIGRRSIINIMISAHVILIDSEDFTYSAHKRLQEI